MPDWPHSPLHRLSESGTYIVTAATYGKQPIFGSKSLLDFLCGTLLRHCREHAWNLQAWAVFPNHYHFVALSTAPHTLGPMIRKLHSKTAREANRRDSASGRKVWFQYRETRITNQPSYLARLNYVHRNAVHHGLVRRAANYPWCSATWFEREASPGFRKTVLEFPCDRVIVPDSFDSPIGV